jgi:hypothetical protein
MIRRFQFSIRDMLWASTVFAVLLSISILVIRNPWLKILGVGLLVGIGCALPTIFARLAESGENSYSEPFVSRTTMLVVAALAGISLPFLVAWFLRLLVSNMRNN